MKRISHLLLTEGTPWKVLLLFSLPVFLGNLIQNFYGLFDGVIVGKILGSEAFGAIGLTGYITYIGTALASGLPSGTSGFTAQLFGAKKQDDVRKSYAVTLLICLVGGFVISALMMALGHPLCHLANLQAGTTVYEDAYLYMMLIFAGITGIFLYNMYLNFLRAIGDSVVPFLLLVIYALLNMAFDYLFIAVFHWGVLGAGLAYDAAVLIAAFVGALWMYFKYPWLRLHRADFSFSKSFLGNHLRMGLPMGIEFSVIGLGCLAMQGAIDSFGSETIAGYITATKVENFLCAFVGGFGSALVAYVGQNYGAGKADRIKQGIRQGFVILLIDWALKALITWALGDRACDLFLSSGSAVTRQACWIYMCWDMLGYGFLGGIYLYRSALLGIGKVIPTFFGGVGELTGRVLLAWVFTPIFGVSAALGGSFFAWMLSALVCGICIGVFVFLNPYFLKNENSAKPTPIS